MSAKEFFLYGRSCNNLAELVPPDQRSLETLRGQMPFSAIIEIDYGTSSLMLQLRKFCGMYLFQKFSVEPVFQSFAARTRQKACPAQSRVS